MELAMGQNPVPPVNIPIPTKIGSKMGGEFTYPKMVPLVLIHSQQDQKLRRSIRAGCSRGNQAFDPLTPWFLLMTHPKAHDPYNAGPRAL